MTVDEKHQKLIDNWYDNLLFNTHREIYDNMTDDQKTVVLLALVHTAKKI